MTCSVGQSCADISVAGTFTKLDAEVVELLCCPLGKAALDRDEGRFLCAPCGSVYPRRAVCVGDHDEHVYDFRIQRPSYCNPKTRELSVGWDDAQADCERREEEILAEDDPEHYFAEIDSVKEIYTEEFHIRGAILDVGGHEGRLRHFLCQEETRQYVSIDPFLNVFEGVQSRANLLKAYPCLSKPCNFVGGRAEELPFRGSVFDWVHMRSVIDHFEDPFMALKEAYRVLRPDGHLMIGLSIQEKAARKAADEPRGASLAARAWARLKRDGVSGLLGAIRRRIAPTAATEPAEPFDDHIFRLTHAQLKDLVGTTGFEIEKEHWQKPPFAHCLYLSARPTKSGAPT